MDRQRRTFDQVAERYHRTRPRYPDSVAEEILRTARTPASGRILGAGARTGQAPELPPDEQTRLSGVFEDARHTSRPWRDEYPRWRD